MNITEAVDLVAYRLGNRTDLDARIKAEMGNIQEFTLERAPLLPWFQLSEDASASTVAGESRISVPADFIRECEESAMWVYDSSADQPWKELEKTDLDKIRRSLGYTIDLTGKPEVYALEGGYYRLAPTPDAVYTLYHRYYKSDDNARDLTGTQTNNWLTYAGDLVVAETCVVMGRQLRFGKEAQMQFESDRKEAEARYLIDQEARKHVNRRYQMGI